MASKTFPLPNELPTTDERFIRLPELQRRLGLSRSSIYRLERDGKLKRCRISAKAVGWTQSSIDQFVQSRIAGENYERQPDPKL